MKKLFITGGHLTPALAVIEEIKKQGMPWEIVFVGRRETMEGEADVSREEEAVSSKGIRFISLTTGRLQRVVTFYSFISFCKIPIGFLQALYYCLVERPQCVLSFGGYIGLPVVVAAFLMRVPVISHEQTTVPGLANRIIAFFAKTICVTFEETKKTFNPKKVIHTGLPVRSDFFKSAPQPFAVDESAYPIIYVTGGSTGSVSLNSLVFPLIREFVKKYTVVHQTGRLSFEEAGRIKQTLTGDEKERYVVRDYFDLKTLSWIMQHASLVVGRSGANTVMEIAMLGKIALFIPLPWSGGGEQTQNALWLEKNGSARVLSQNKARSADVSDSIAMMMNDKKTYMSHAEKLAKDIPRDAAVRLVGELGAVLR